MPRRKNRQPGGSGNTNTNSRKAQMLARLQRKKKQNQKIEDANSLVQKYAKITQPLAESGQSMLDTGNDMISYSLGAMEDLLHKQELTLSATLQLKKPELKTTDSHFIALLRKAKKEDPEYQDLLKSCERNGRMADTTQAMRELSKAAIQPQSLQGNLQLVQKFFGTGGLFNQLSTNLDEQFAALDATFAGLDSESDTEADEADSATSSAAARQRLNMFSNSKSGDDASPKQERRRMLPRAK